MQDLKRARIFGSRSAGAALPSVIESLPNGDLFQFAVANYVSESGKELEGVGVKPDVEVAHTAAALRAGKDLVVGAALDWIYANSSLPGRP
jgi:carboxyl-terminal processing protease